MSRYLCFMMVSLIGLACHGQSAKQYIQKGNVELKAGFPQSALFYFEKAVEIEASDVQANFKAAECSRALRDYQKAAQYYSAAIDFDNKDKYLEAHYYLGLMLKQQGNYRDAQRRFDYFLSIFKQRNEFYRKARQESEACSWALSQKGENETWRVGRPDSGLNTVHAEMSPFLLNDSTLLISTMRYENDEVKKKDPVFVAFKAYVHRDSSWNEIMLPLPIKINDRHTANGCFNGDSTLFFFSVCTSINECALHMMSKVDGQWGAPIALDAPFNEVGSSSTQPTIAKLGDEETLLFVTNRERGKGGYDIWYADFRRGKLSTRVRNLGSKFNTMGDEITPYFDISDSSLYFASNWHNGYGGFDLFVSKGEIGRSTNPENLGKPINSPADDYYPFINQEAGIGYFVSNRSDGLKKAGNKTCCNDIYQLGLIIEEENVPPPPDTVDTLIVEVPEAAPIPETIEQLQDYLPISLYFHNDRPEPRTLDTTTTQTYEQTLLDYLSRKQEYLSNIASSNSLANAAKDSVSKQVGTFFDMELERSLDRLEQATDILYEELKKGSEIELAVRGYASPLAKSDYNLNLTLRRIHSMENFFKTYKGGVLIPYMAGHPSVVGKLTILRIPYGESKAASNVSDSAQDKVSAIYSLSAALERRIEILRIEKK